MEKQTSFKVLKDVYVENDLSYAQKVWAARNLCILTNRVHSAQRGITIGDYNADTVSYTHLDVYKRQGMESPLLY